MFPRHPDEDTAEKGRIVSSALLAAVLTLLSFFSAQPVANALVHPYHKSATYTNNGCKWYGVHEAAQQIGGQFSAAAGTYRVSGCVEVHVRLKVDSAPILEDYDFSLATVAVQPMSVLKYSDHNANPSGPPPYVGFRFST